ncbi:hypothetical protein VFPBJ_08313 [Purpureocillium lilacinum]|uniref:Uncharacterized protein n=1 Tax=Purpureocillium lilacinum TaxID=33203 RepID=A0A179GKB8_PURLI|nr:hypothetical protein VFPBJ_08313 [Purpureocillium lilacinum]
MDRQDGPHVVVIALQQVIRNAVLGENEVTWILHPAGPLIAGSHGAYAVKIPGCCNLRLNDPALLRPKNSTLLAGSPTMPVMTSASMDIASSSFASPASGGGAAEPGLDDLLSPSTNLKHDLWQSKRMAKVATALQLTWMVGRRGAWF